jgi:hypothetical protein
MYWMPQTQPDLRGGKASTTFENLDYPSVTKYAPGVALSIPVSAAGMINVSGFEMKNSGSIPAAQNVQLFSTAYVAGTPIVYSYSLYNIRVSYQDLLYPFPKKEGQKFRFKTLWELQYTNMKAGLDQITVDSSGNVSTNPVLGTRRVIYPALGMGGEYNFSRYARLNFEGSGFSIPHHSTIWNLDASLLVHRGHVGFEVGEKAYHFSTSAQNDQFFKATLRGPYAALRWYGGSAH